MVLAGSGWFWLVLDGSGWFWMVLAGSGWFRCLAQPPKNAEWRKWREEILNVILKYRVADKHFKEQLEKDKVHICERHFKPEQVNKDMPIYSK